MITAFHLLSQHGLFAYVENNTLCMPVDPILELSLSRRLPNMVRIQVLHTKWSQLVTIIALSSCS
jgi:hypothetical protein